MTSQLNSSKLSFSQPDLFWAWLLSTVNLWQKIHQIRLIHHNLRSKRPCYLLGISYFMRREDRGVSNISEKHVRSWKGRVGPGHSQRDGAWLQIKQPGFRDLSHHQTLQIINTHSCYIFGICKRVPHQLKLSFPANDFASTERGVNNKRIRVCPRETGSAAHFLLSETECDTWHQVIQEA